MSSGSRLGILGSMFDPVHWGHLDAVAAAQSALRLDQICLVPSNAPPHRPHRPFASAFHRFTLASLATLRRKGYYVSDLELTRQGFSYTANTLRALHADGWKPSQLFFITGADAFAEIATWHEYPDVLDAANFVVVARPGTRLEHAMSRTPGVRARLHHPPLADSMNGPTLVIPVEAATRDVSSTMVRGRVAAGQSIEDLVPEAVADHILRHQLYRSVTDLHGDKEDSN